MFLVYCLVHMSLVAGLHTQLSWSCPLTSLCILESHLQPFDPLSGWGCGVGLFRPGLAWKPRLWLGLWGLRLSRSIGQAKALFKARLGLGPASGRGFFKSGLSLGFAALNWATKFLLLSCFPYCCCSAHNRFLKIGHVTCNNASNNDMMLKEFSKCLKITTGTQYNWTTKKIK